MPIVERHRNQRTVIMPAALRPSIVAIILAVTTWGTSGCAFPFTRGSDAKFDQAMQGEPQADPRETSSSATNPDGSKPLPPFARFLGGFFRGDTTPETQVTNIEEVTAISVAAPAQAVPAMPPPETPADQAPTHQAAPVVAAESLMTLGTPAAPPVSELEDPAAKDQQLPVIVAAVEVAQTPPSQPQAVEPAIPAEQLNQYAQTPWDNGRSLLQQAKQNSSAHSTTLAHSLDLALENYRHESASQTVGHETVSLTVEPQLESSEIPSGEPVAAISEAPSEDKTRIEMAENPLRLAQGKTDWSGRSTRADAAPQTVVNLMAPDYPKTDTSPLTNSNDPVMDRTVVGHKEKPAATPQITVNPFAKPAAEPRPSQPVAPQIVTNPMVVPTADLEPTPISTDAIHFQSSLLEKLQAANQQAAWNFAPQTTKPADVSNITVLAEPVSDMPQIVTSQELTPQPERPSSEAEGANEAAAGMVMNPMASPSQFAEPTNDAAKPLSAGAAPAKESTEPNVPFVVANPVTRPNASRGAVIRAAQPNPWIINNSETQPKLPPVVRASEYEAPAAASTHRGTKIYVIEGKSP